MPASLIFKRAEDYINYNNYNYLGIYMDLTFVFNFCIDAFIALA